MKQLAGLDASFLFLETPEMPMHVGALHIFELPAGYRGNYVRDLRAHMASRLPLAPALRRKLALMPMNLASPAWVDATPDLDQHIVAIKLPRGSGQAELEQQVGLLHPVLLDRSRPLWKFHVFEGLTNGPAGTKRYGLYTQLHHAAVDGQAAVALAHAILDLTPEPRALPDMPARAARSAPGTTQLLRRALAGQWQQTLNIAKALPGAVSTLAQMAAQSAGGAAGGVMSDVMARVKGRAASSSKGVSNLSLAPRTRLNATLSAQRVFCGVSLPLAELNAVRRRHGASLNDAVLMICSGALRRYFAKHGPLPRKSLIAAVPVSTRAKGDTTANNQASMTVFSLGTHITDPGKRLAHVLAASAAMKSNLDHVKGLMPTDFPSLGVPWLMEGAAALYKRAGVAEKIPPIANVAISNVPGPTVPLYMAGARMLKNYPTSIVVHGMALNITVQTYNDALDMGLIACAQAMPEVTELGEHVQAAFAEFAALPAPAAEAAPAAKKTSRKAVTPATKRPRASAPTQKRASR
ncbi:MAG: wax ester/triacylglycerol synthase family O-acyltransferase [Burkholderiaceae bacterium]|nr:wax ester/triacylglycerol synthase family O-acyltransferase [Burkholderiaceae bacterium]